VGNSTLTTVRDARQDDARALAAVAAATFPLACPPTTTAEAKADFIATHLSEARFGDYLGDAARSILIAEQDGVIVGYSMLVFDEPSDADVRSVVLRRPAAELSKFYILPDRHGGGVARILMEASVRVAAERGADSVWLGVNQSNGRANRFYEKSGFDKVGTRRFLVGASWESDFVREHVLVGVDSDR